MLTKYPIYEDTLYPREYMYPQGYMYPRGYIANFAKTPQILEIVMYGPPSGNRNQSPRLCAIKKHRIHFDLIFVRRCVNPLTQNTIVLEIKT